jgi:hypothetical protein
MASFITSSDALGTGKFSRILHSNACVDAFRSRINALVCGIPSDEEADAMARTGWMLAAGAVIVAGVFACAGTSGGPGGTSSDAGRDGEGGSGSGGGSSSGSTGDVTYSCTNGTGTSTTCSQQQVSSSLLASTQQACTQGGGTPGTTCPAAGLAGCCAISGIVACYYDATKASSIQTSCTSEGGTWSTTP